MIHHVIYLRLSEKVDSTVLEGMVRASRTRLLEIPEVLSVRSGRNLDPNSQWQSFHSFEVESREKLKLLKEDGFHLKFWHRFIQPNAKNRFELEFELDPSCGLKYP